MNDISSRRFAGGSWPIEAPPDEVVLDFSTSGRRPRIGVLVNPYSGGNRIGLANVRNAIYDYPQVFHRDVRTPQDVLAALVDFAHNDVNLVAINGGDGTVQAALTVLFHRQPFEKLPVLTVMQSGTTSMTARDVGPPGSPVKVLRKLFRWAQTGDGKPITVRRPVLRVAAPGHPIRYGMFFGAAAIYQGIQYFHRNLNGKGLRGEVGPGLTILRFLWALVNKNKDFSASVPLTVKLDQNPATQFDFLVVLISTLERLLLGMHPYWGREKGALHYTAIKANPRHLVRALPSFFRGFTGYHNTPENGFFSHNASEIKLNLAGGFTLDGQLYTPENQQEPTVVRDGGTATFLVS
jgi:hypothetical protein